MCDKRLWIAGLVFSLLTQVTTAATITIPPDGPAQMPVVYVHGYIDDGAEWARGEHWDPELAPNLETLYNLEYVTSPASSPSALLSAAGLSNWAVQWHSSKLLSNGRGDPASSAAEGYAFLQTSQDLMQGTDWMKGSWTTQNFPSPDATSVLLAPLVSVETDLAVTATAWVVDNLLLNGWPVAQTVVGSVGASWLAYKLNLVSSLGKTHSYNTAGRLDPRAENLAQMIRREQRTGGRLESWRQVNVITHSMGSLMTRSALDKLHQRGRTDSERVANVIYNAPPFAGSTVATLGGYLLGAKPDGSTLLDPFIERIIAEAVKPFLDNPSSVTLGEFVTVLLEMASPSFDVDPTPLIEELGIGPLLDQKLSELFEQSPEGDWRLTPKGRLDLSEAMVTFAPLYNHFEGKDGRPGVYDLTPQAGLTHLTEVQTNPDVKQFVTLGRGAELGVLNLFPANYIQIASNPSLVADVDEYVVSLNDSAVSVGSAKLLTETDAFGPRMNLLADLPLTHPDLIYDDVRTMGPYWLKIFLAAQSSLKLHGSISTAGDRAYLLDGEAEFEFSAQSVTRTVSLPRNKTQVNSTEATVTVTGQQIEYRVVPDNGAGATPSEWMLTSPSQKLSLNALVDALGLEDQPFFLEWRSVNQYGGKEAIRSALIVLAGEAPQIVDYHIITPSADEVHRNPRTRNTSLASRSVRLPTLLDSTSLNLLSQIVSEPEAAFVLSRQESKALAIQLDSTGDIEYQWDSPTLQNPQTSQNITSKVLTLSGLDDGLHTLYVRTSRTTVFNGTTVVKKGPPQALRIFIDNTPPVVDFMLADNHPRGTVISPETVLTFRAEDLGGDGGNATVRLREIPGANYDARNPFTLSSSGIRDLLSDGGLVAAEVHLDVYANDSVNNSVVQTYPVWIDVAPPVLGVQTPPGAIKTGDFSYTVAQPTFDLLMDVDDESGFGFNPPLVSISNIAETSSKFVLNTSLGGISGYPDLYGLRLALSEGENVIAVSVTDTAGQSQALSILVIYRPVVYDGVSVQLLSPRKDIEVLSSSGATLSKTPGNIDAVVTSFSGDVVAFKSAGNQFSGNDNNQRSDIYVWRDGQQPTLASLGDQGQLLNNDAKDPSLSGNGRFLFFSSTASNVIDGLLDPTNTNTVNYLYVRDLANGAVAMVSTKPDGTPGGCGGGCGVPAVSYDGRYVFYTSTVKTLVNNITDNNSYSDIFVTDLDPDGDGDFFNSTYSTRQLSVQYSNKLTAAGGNSRFPSVSIDGTRLLFLSGANDIHPHAATNTQGTNNAIRLTFSKNSDGSVNFDNPAVLPMNRAKNLYGGSEDVKLTVNGVNRAVVSPVNGHVAFSTRSNIVNSGDDNSTTSGQDVYVTQYNETSPLISWVSRGANNAQSNLETATTMPVSMAEHFGLNNEEAYKVGWVSDHTNIVSNDSNQVADLFVKSSPQVTGLAELPVINWITPELPSASAVQLGGITPDGRYAWWVSSQSYLSPYTPGPANLYRRRIDPIHRVTLTTSRIGAADIQVLNDDVSGGINGIFSLPDTATAQVKATPATGFRFVRWEGADTTQGQYAFVRMDRPKSITAVMEATVAPSSASATLITEVNTAITGVLPTIVSSEAQQYSLSIVQQGTHGVASTDGSTLSYTPNQGFVGTDAFLFQVQNQYGQILSAPAVASVVVTSAGNSGTISGGINADTIYGTELNDKILGYEGNDRLSGLAGDDELDGGPGDDTLIGGPGSDILVGGPGVDSFEGVLLDFNGDVLADFSELDKIRITDADLRSLDGTDAGGTLQLGNGVTITLPGIADGTWRVSYSAGVSTLTLEEDIPQGLQMWLIKAALDRQAGK